MTEQAEQLKGDLFEAEKLAIEFCAQYGYAEDTREYEVAINAFCVGYRYPRLFRADEMTLSRIYDAGRADERKTTRPAPAADVSAVVEALRHVIVDAERSLCNGSTLNHAGANVIRGINERAKQALAQHDAAPQPTKVRSLSDADYLANKEKYDAQEAAETAHELPPNTPAGFRNDMAPITQQPTKETAK